MAASKPSSKKRQRTRLTVRMIYGNAAKLLFTEYFANRPGPNYL
ncbi:MAG TPA: hypothetical protein VH186_01950 [Chloroflexia bacterium]|nr:hypothetical protein [Chloroflexia bacterium]